MMRRWIKYSSTGYINKIEKVPRVKTRQVREIWSQQLEHISMQVPKSGTELGVRKGKRPCWHEPPIAKAPWKLLVIR